MKHHFLFAMLLLALGAGASAATPGTAKGAVAYENGLVTVQAEGLPVMPVLEDLSRQAGIHVFLFEPLRSNRIPGTVESLPLDRFLRRVLKGSSHAILYRPTGAAQSRGKTLDEAPAGTTTANAQPGHESEGAGGSTVSQIAVLKDEPSTPTEASEASSRVHAGGIPSGTAPVRATATVRPLFDTPLQRAEDRVASTPGVSAYGFSMASHEASGTLASATPTQAVPGSSGGGAAIAATPAGTGDTTTSAEALQAPTAPPPGVNVPEDFDWTTKDQIQLIVDHLEERIDSGQSDRDYEKWASIKGEKYVTHDKELLAYYEQRLASLP